jgi:hypothetical protein
MNRLFVLCSAATLVACAKTEGNPDSAASAMPPAVSAGTISLTSVAGTYDVVVKNEAGDSTLTTYVLNATDSTAWTMTFPGRAPIPVRVISVGGDSIITQTGPYESALRKGIQVTTDVVMRAHDNMLMGSGVAHYAVKTADSVRTVRIEGTKK